MISHAADFQNFQSPPLPDYSNEAVPSAHGTRDIESHDGESTAVLSLQDTDIYGPLRKGDPVKFFSKECAGVVAATCASAFTCECLSSVVEPMMQQHFALSTIQLAALHRLVATPAHFGFFFGLISDCYPIRGFRRKAYLIISIMLTTLGYFVLSALNAYGESLNQGSARTSLAVVMTTFAVLTGTGDMVTFLCIHTRVIELSQRESLRMRGALIATYSIFRFGIFVVTSTLAYVIRSNVTHHSTELTVYGLVMALTIPLVWTTWQEKYYSLSTSIRTRSQILWKVMQQKAVWSVLVFLCISTLFDNIRFMDPTILLSVWSGAANDDFLLQQVLSYIAMTVPVIVWRYGFVNRSWRAFFSMSTLLLVVPQCFGAICIVLDIFRDRYFYNFINLFPSLYVGIAWLSSIVPLTEITQEGSEGAMVGLMTSLYYSIVTFVQANSYGLFRGSNFYDAEQAAMDTSEARLDVLQTLFLNYGINALALFGIFFLPRQKLDTQQLRSYGGFTKFTSAAILTFVAVPFRTL